MNKNYLKGYRFEKRVQKFFEDRGFFVIRSGKSAFPDLVAIPNSDDLRELVFLIECKTDIKNLSKREREELEQIYYTYKTVVLVAYRKNSKIKFKAYNGGDWEDWEP